MCETCDLVTKMYSAIKKVDYNIGVALYNMICETSLRITEPQQNNVPYHLLICSTPTEGMPHNRMPIIENAIKDFFKQNNLRLD